MLHLLWLVVHFLPSVEQVDAAILQVLTATWDQVKSGDLSVFATTASILVVGDESIWVLWPDDFIGVIDAPKTSVHVLFKLDVVLAREDHAVVAVAVGANTLHADIVN